MNVRAVWNDSSHLHVFLITMGIYTPLVMMEVLKRPSPGEKIPTFIFLLLAGLSMFILYLLSLRKDYSGSFFSIFSPPVKFIFIGVCTWLWVLIFFDQLPCFLGHAFCD